MKWDAGPPDAHPVLKETYEGEGPDDTNRSGSEFIGANRNLLNAKLTVAVALNSSVKTHRHTGHGNTDSRNDGADRVSNFAFDVSAGSKGLQSKKNGGLSRNPGESGSAAEGSPRTATLSRLAWINMARPPYRTSSVGIFPMLSSGIGRFLFCTLQSGGR